MDILNYAIAMLYVVGTGFYIYSFFVHRAEINKLKNVTELMERYFKVFKVDDVENFVKLKEKSFELEKGYSMSQTRLG